MLLFQVQICRALCGPRVQAPSHPWSLLCVHPVVPELHQHGEYILEHWAWYVRPWSHPYVFSHASWLTCTSRDSKCSGRLFLLSRSMMLGLILEFVDRKLVHVMYPMYQLKLSKEEKYQCFHAQPLLPVKTDCLFAMSLPNHNVVNRRSWPHHGRTLTVTWTGEWLPASVSLLYLYLTHTINYADLMCFMSFLGLYLTSTIPVITYPSRRMCDELVRGSLRSGELEFGTQLLLSTLRIRFE